MHKSAAPILIALPQGFSLGGVTSWAVRLARGAAARGRSVTIIKHERSATGIAQPELPGVAVRTITGAPPVDCCAGNYAPYAEHYLRAIDALSPTHEVPLVMLPNLAAEAYGLAAHLSRLRPGLLRVVSWTHSDIAHDYRMAEHYAPLIVRFAGVSDHIARELRRRIPARAGHIARLWYGIEAEPCASSPRGASLPIHLIYAGRFDHFQKRILVLPHLSRALLVMGINHTLELIGDGPARDELAEAARGLPITLAPPLQSVALAARLRGADLFVLPSRFEGLSIAMLEAMARGCVPIVTRIASGAEDAIEDGRTGVLVDVAGEAADHEVGEAMARGVAKALSLGIGSLSDAARRCASDRFGMDRHVESALALIDDAAASPASDWPHDCTPAAADASGFGFSVPQDAAARTATALKNLAGRTVALWGAGRHTRAIAPVITDSPARIIAIIDDDASNHGRSLLGVPIVGAQDAARLGATDVVISSALHERELWTRRAPLEALGLRIHRLYADEPDQVAA